MKTTRSENNRWNRLDQAKKPYQALLSFYENEDVDKEAFVRSLEPQLGCFVTSDWEDLVVLRNDEKLSNIFGFLWTEVKLLLEDTLDSMNMLGRKALPKDLKTPAMVCAREFIKSSTSPILFKDKLKGLVKNLQTTILFGGRRCGKTTALLVVFEALLDQIEEKRLFVFAIDFRVLFQGSKLKEQELCERYVDQLERTLEIYGISNPACLSTLDLTTASPAYVFYDLPLKVARDCGFEGVFLLHDEIEYTAVRTDKPGFCFNTLWRGMAIDARIIMLAAGSNVFAMCRVMQPYVNNSIAVLDKGVVSVSLSVVDEEAYREVYSEDMDEFCSKLGGYPGYIEQYKKYGVDKLRASVKLETDKDIDNLKNIFRWEVELGNTTVNVESVAMGRLLLYLKDFRLLAKPLPTKQIENLNQLSVDHLLDVGCLKLVGNYIEHACTFFGHIWQEMTESFVSCMESVK